MNDLDFARSVKKYLERRGKMGGSALFRIRAGAGEVLAPPRADARERTREPSRAASTELTLGPGGYTNEYLSERTSGDGGPESGTGSVGPSPPMRREYIVKGPVNGTPESAQAELFGEERAVPAISDLAALDLEALGERVSKCTLCTLCEGRNRTVFGTGDSKAKIVFIGEAPGREEDLRGEPFVGRAGQLLTKILASVGFTREDVYITNILKCRPPENRDPNEREVRACKPYLKRQIELLDPVLICALGRVAGQNLLERKASLSVLRQHIHYYEDVRTIVTYHPAALLRNPNLKRAAWEDIQETRRIYDEALKDT